MEAGRRSFHKILAPYRPSASVMRVLIENVGPSLRRPNATGSGLPPSWNSNPSGFPYYVLDTLSPLASHVVFPDSVGRFLFT